MPPRSQRAVHNDPPRGSNPRSASEKPCALPAELGERFSVYYKTVVLSCFLTHGHAKSDQLANQEARRRLQEAKTRDRHRKSSNEPGDEHAFPLPVSGCGSSPAGEGGRPLSPSLSVLAVSTESNQQAKQEAQRRLQEAQDQRSTHESRSEPTGCGGLHAGTCQPLTTRKGPHST